ARARDDDGSDRIGGRPEAYHQKVDLAFRLIAAEEPERVRVIDASGSQQDVTTRLMDAIADLLP
ncbi:MAG: thymidylate kinase, partial [Sphingomonas sp.]|nr:thymidylate kinase [Sphingomonas sp.]